MKASFALPLLVLAPCLTAQAIQPTGTIPTGYLKKTGESMHALGFLGISAREMGIYSPSAAGSTVTARTISELAFRQNEGVGKQVAFTVDVAILLSSKGSKWNTAASMKFDTNHGSDKRTFFPKSKLNFPAAPYWHTGPRPWVLAFKGQAPFTVVAKEGLVIDFKVYSKSSTFLSNSSDAAKFFLKGETLAYGVICPNGFGIVSQGNEVHPTATWKTHVTQGLPGAFVLTWCDAKLSNFKLPGLACPVLAFPLFAHPTLVRSDASGNSAANAWDWGRVPAAMVGQSIYTQALGFQSMSTLALSAGLRVSFGAGPSATSPFQSLSGLDFGLPPHFDPDKSDALTYSASTAMIFGIR